MNEKDRKVADKMIKIMQDAGMEPDQMLDVIKLARDRFSAMREKDNIKDKDMKKHILTFAEMFPNGHPKFGLCTDFHYNILSGKKIHTIKSLDTPWLKVMKEINSGHAYLSLRTEIGEFMRLYNIGLEFIHMHKIADEINWQINSRKVPFTLADVAANDGLGYEDFLRWFFPDRTQNAIYEGSIIHFTNFRYTPPLTYHH